MHGPGHRYKGTLRYFFHSNDEHYIYQSHDISKDKSMSISTCKVSKENGYMVQNLLTQAVMSKKFLRSHPGISDEKSEDYIKTTCTSLWP